MNFEKESMTESLQSQNAEIEERFETLKKEFNSLKDEQEFYEFNGLEKINSPFKMASREQIIENFKKMNYVYARVDKQINAPLKRIPEIEITFFTEKNGKILEFPVSQSDYEALKYKSNPTENVKKIYKEVGKDCVVDPSNSFRILSNNFAFSGTALKYDNNLKNDVRNIKISSIHQKDFDESIFFENKPKSKNFPYSKKCMPIPFQLDSNKKPKAKISNTKKISPSTLSEQDLADNKVCLELSSEHLNNQMLLIEKRLNYDGDVSRYLRDKESCIQQHEVYRKQIDLTPKYKHEFKECDAQCDYVCGILCYNEGKYELHDWFIISRPFRNFISMLKYPEIFNERYLKKRERNNVYKSSPGTDTPMNKKWMNFEIDKSDALSGNQNVICNTYRKWQLLKNDYREKLNYEEFWLHLKKKISTNDDYDEQISIVRVFKEIISKEITDSEYDKFYKKIFVDFSEKEFKILVKKYLPSAFEEKDKILRDYYLEIFESLNKKLENSPSKLTSEIKHFCNNFKFIPKDNVEKVLREILESDKEFESELKLLNEKQKSVYNSLWPDFINFLKANEKEKNESIDRIFPDLAKIESKIKYLVLYVRNHNKHVKINNYLLKELENEKRFDENQIKQFILNNTKECIKIKGVEENTLMPERFVDEIAGTFYKQESFKFSELGFPKDKLNDIYRFLRTEKFTIERAHDIVVLILYIIYNENIFHILNNGRYNYILYDKNMILYHDTFVHASWDIHDWLYEKLYSEPMITRKYKFNWAEQTTFED